MQGLRRNSKNRQSIHTLGTCAAYTYYGNDTVRLQQGAQVGKKFQGKQIHWLRATSKDVVDDDIVLRVDVGGQLLNNLHCISDHESVVSRQPEILEREFMNHGIQLQDGGVDSMCDHGSWSRAYSEANIQSPCLGVEKPRFSRTRLNQSDSFEHGKDCEDGLLDARLPAFGRRRSPFSTKQAVIASHHPKLGINILEDGDVACD